MKVHQLVDPTFDVNLYVVDADRPVVVDCGTGREPQHIARLVGSFLGDRAASAILITHRHFDHSGGANDLMRDFRVAAYAGPEEDEALRRADAFTIGSGLFGGRVEPVAVETLKPGESWDCGSLRLEAILTPGHTSGHLAFWEPSSRSLIGGDLVFAGGGVGRWDLPTGDYDALVRSLERVAEMRVRNLYPGHGPYAEGDGDEHVALGLRMLRMAYR